MLGKKKWLEEIARRNEKRYGKRRMDCCGLNNMQVQTAYSVKPRK